MTNLLFWLKKNKHSVIYSVFLFCTFELILRVLQDLGTWRYVTASVLFCILLVGELSYGMLYIRKRYTRDEIGNVVWPLMRSHLLHQFILPIMLYIGMIGFIFFYPHDVLVHIMIMVTSATYWLLFLNIRAVYNHDFELKQLSHGIYNFVKIIVFFLLTTSALELMHYLHADYIVIVLALFCSTFILFALILSRYMQVSYRSIVIILLFSIAIAIFAWYFGHLVFTTYFNMGLFLTILFYLLSSLVNHKAEGTLSLLVIIEYFAISLLSIVMLTNTL